MAKTCKTCRFWRGPVTAMMAVINYGQCVKQHGKSFEILGKNNVMLTVHATEPHDSCGEHQPKDPADV